MQYIIRTYAPTGALWERRYKSSVIQAETYLLYCQRYITLHSIRAAIAAMVDGQAYYHWANYRANPSGQPDSRIGQLDLYLSPGTRAKKRHRAYRALFRAGLDQAA